MDITVGIRIITIMKIILTILTGDQSTEIAMDGREVIQETMDIALDTEKETKMTGPV